MLVDMDGKFIIGESKLTLVEEFCLNPPLLSISKCNSRHKADLSVSVVSLI